MRKSMQYTTNIQLILKDCVPISNIKGINQEKLEWYLNPKTLALYKVYDENRYIEIPYNKNTSINNSGYKLVNLSGKTITFHKIVANTIYGNNDNLEIYHINGDKLDNRPENLRFVTKSDNMKNFYSKGGYREPKRYFGKYSRKTGEYVLYDKRIKMSYKDYLLMKEKNGIKLSSKEKHYLYIESEQKPKLKLNIKKS